MNASDFGVKTRIDLQVETGKASDGRIVSHREQSGHTTNSEPRLFDDRPAPNNLPPTGRNHPETSREAARFVSKRLTELQQKVYEAIESAGTRGMTDLEVEAATKIPLRTCGPRRLDLWKKFGLVTQSGLFRPTPSGCKSTVWIATKFASGGAE